MTSSSARPTVAVVGAGAAGALTGIHVCETALRRRQPLDLVLIDPAPEAGRGTAYATRDPDHRLNVPVGGMSCYPDDQGHFHRWLCRHGEPDVRAADFVSRHRYGSYLGSELGRRIVAAAGVVSVRRLRLAAVRCRWPAGAEKGVLELGDGSRIEADHVVLATGPAPGGAWVPQELQGAPGLVRLPWDPGALEDVARGKGDVLLVGTGLTAVDLAVTLTASGRRGHAASRSGLLPQKHAVAPLPAVPPPPGLDRGRPAALVRSLIRRHLASTVRTCGDWRPAMDGLRPLTATLWQGMTDRERAEFLTRDAAWWNTHRHRMAPPTAEALERARAAGRFALHTGRVSSVRVLEDGRFDTVLADGTRIVVDWLVDCSGPGSQTDAADPLWQGLLADGIAVPGPLGMGVATDDGRLRDTRGETPRSLFTLGAPRRGELWETTAIPEIREQAQTLARTLVPPRRTPSRRRPVDTFDLPLSTDTEAATAYRDALSKILTLRDGAVDDLHRAVKHDPGFALGHATLALLGHEWDVATDPAQALAQARRSVRDNGDEREHSFVQLLHLRLSGRPHDRELATHLERFPRDALVLALVVPTIAFSGSGDLDDEQALRLLDATTPAYGDHWFHGSLLAFLRQEQGRLEEAGEMARSALAAEPASAHAAHALTHVHYETGSHDEGLTWLDDWLAEPGRGAGHRAHFSWHAALHELALDDGQAVERRWLTQLRPCDIGPVRALVDAGSLLWRAPLAGTWDAEAGLTAELVESLPGTLLDTPQNAFVGLHSAVAHAQAGDSPGLRGLAAHAASAGGVRGEVIAPLCTALADMTEASWDAAARKLQQIVPAIARVGGSAAQREVVEETLLYALTSAGRYDEARALLETRLERRSSPLDRRRQLAVARNA